MNVEQELERVLRRESPPEGFSERVLDRIASGERIQRSRWRTAAASVTLAALLAGFAGHQVAERGREEGERAREEVLLALRIASEKVRYAQQEVRSIGN